MAKTCPVVRTDGRVVRVTVPGAGGAPAAPPAYTADCEAVRDFLAAWHEAGRYDFTRNYLYLDYDACEPKLAVDRRKFIALDRGESGCHLLEKATGMVWTVSGYGRPNRRFIPGPLDQMTEQFQAQAAARPMPAWYDRTTHELLRDARGSPAGEAAGLLGMAADRAEDRGCVAAAGLIRFRSAGVALAATAPAKAPMIEALWRDLWRLPEVTRT